MMGTTWVLLVLAGVLLPCWFASTAAAASSSGSLVDTALLLRMRSNGALLSDGWRKNAATAVVAALQFNERSTEILPALGNHPSLVGCDKNLSINVIDTNSAPQPSLKALLSLDPQPQMVIGAARSAVSLPVALLTGALDTPQVSYWSTTPRLNNKADYPTFARVIPDDGAVAMVLAELMSKNYKYTHASMIYVNDAYGAAYQEVTFTACQSLGITLKSFPFDYGDQNSIKVALSLLAKESIHVVIAIVFDNDFAALIDEADRAGVMGPGWLWVYTDSVTGNDFKSLSTQRRSLVSGSLHLYPNGGSTLNAGWNKLNDYFGRGVRSEIDRVNSYLPPNGLNPTFNYSLSEDVWKNVRFDISAFTFDSVIAAGFALCASTDIENGKAVWSELVNVSFEGVSGNVAFDKETGSRLASSATYVIHNIYLGGDGALVDKDVGLYSSGSWNLKASKIIYSDGLNFAPTDLVIPKHNFHFLRSAFTTTGYFFFTVVFLLAVCFSAWTIVQRKSVVVKASQWQFLFLICFGVSMSISSILPFATDDTESATIENVKFWASDDQSSLSTCGSALGEEKITTNTWSCMLSVWLFKLGGTLTFGALFVKTYRVSKIFNNKKMIQIHVSVQEMYRYMGALLLVDAIILGVWTADDPLVLRRSVEARDRFGFPLDSYASCVSVKGRSEVYISLLAVIHIGLLIYGTYLCWTVRKVSTRFREGAWITFCIVSRLQFIVLAIPIVATISNDRDTLFVVIAGIIFLADSVLLMAMFVPKIYAHSRWMFNERNGIPNGAGLGVTRTATGSRSSKMEMSKMKSYATSGSKSGESHPKKSQSFRVVTSNI